MSEFNYHDLGRFPDLEKVPVFLISEEEARRLTAENRASAWNDNPEFARSLNLLIEGKAFLMHALVKDFVVQIYETLRLREFEREYGNRYAELSALSAFRKLEKKYESVNRIQNTRLIKKPVWVSPILYLNHPSVEITHGLRTHLIERGFHQSGVYRDWVDACGSKIHVRSWVEDRNNRNNYDDPAGVIPIIDEYENRYWRIVEGIESAGWDLVGYQGQ